MKLFVGNLPPSISDEELKKLFSAHGDVTSAKVIMDRETGRSKGFGFVEMKSKEEAENAMKSLDQKTIGNGKIVVNEARPQTERRESPFKKNRY